MSYSPRERVLSAIAHEQPDRVPLALWCSWCGVTDKLYFNVLSLLGWQPVAPFRPDLLHSVNYYDDRLLEYLGADIRHVDPGVTALTARVDGQGFDRWGLQWRKAGAYRAASHFPLENGTVEDVARYPLPTPDDFVKADAIRARLAAIGRLGEEYAVSGRAVASYGLFEMAQSLRRHEQLLMDMALEPDFVHALVGRLADCYGALIERFLDIAGARLDLLELPGDDFAGNNGLLISPAMFDEFFNAPYAWLIARIKTHSPHIKVAFHSDGAITQLLPRLADMGVDIFHPLEPLPATDPVAVKAAVGDRLTFLGGIDIRTTMQGSVDGIRAEVRERIAQLAANGGYILAPANHLQEDVPPENLIALYDAARSDGPHGTI